MPLQKTHDGPEKKRKNIPERFDVTLNLFYIS
jgi:hypothetical protein